MAADAVMPPEWLPMVGHRVCVLLERQGLSRTALAAAAGVGVWTVIFLEEGGGKATLLEVWRIADVLSVHIADLVAEPGRSPLDGELGGLS